MTDYKVKFLFADAVTIEQEFPGGVVVRDAKSTLIANWPAGMTRPNSPTPPDAPGACTALHPAPPCMLPGRMQRCSGSPCRLLAASFFFRGHTPAPNKFAPQI